MKKRPEKKPTDRELEILQILWGKGPSTVRSVNNEMNRQRETGYTTTLKIMQLMSEKGFLTRDDTQFKHVYRPAVSCAAIQKRLLRHLIERAFSGSAEKLVMGALSEKKLSKQEIAAVKRMLDIMEEK